ncbi:MAG TPA: hypothetical protein DCE41_34370, partial [Cytophagales bacterium]|nr:hypothetical protein [Cytophagales bacterium]
GLVTAQIYASQGAPIVGDSLQIEASVNGLPYQAVAYSDAEGKIYFRNLAYSAEGISYRVSPAGNAQDFDKEEASLVLDKTVYQGSAGIFINQRSRVIEGTITNQFCDCGRDSVEVLLYTVNGSGETEVSATERVKTDHEGKFSFTIPYLLTDISGYKIAVGNQSLDELGENMEDYGYYYLGGTDMEIDENDSTLTLTLAAADLLTQETTAVEIFETTNHPVSVAIAGPGDCDVFAGYEFTVRLRDTDGKVDRMVETVNRQLDLTLPPLNYIVSVIDVNKSDAFSQGVLDYFRSRTLQIGNKANYVAYLETEDEQYLATQYLRYNERATLSIEGIDDIEYADATCDPIYVMIDDDESDLKTEVDIPHTVTLKVTPEQIIGGQACSVNSGYILGRFSGGTVTVPGAEDDTIRYDENLNTWEAIEVTATTPNLVTPYKQLLEFYYYDASGNYQGATSAEIFVVGKQQLDGQDVFVLLEQETSVPIYVLRDPPGDQSSSYIKEKSNLFFNLESGFSSEAGISVEREFKMEIAGFITGTKLKGGAGLSGESSSGQMYALEFSDGLSTLGGAAASDNLQGALDGRDADVVVGLDVILAYGMTEVLDFESCEPSKSRTLSVEPTEISTMWAYTRSQINTTIDYYKALTEDGSNYTIESDTDDDIITRLETSYQQFETILEDLDTKYTPTCEMCTYVHTTTSYDPGNHNMALDLETIKSFCTDNNLYSEDGCSTTALEEIISTWDEDVRNDYREAYRKYLVLREGENSDYAYGYMTNGTLESELSSFDPLENITFSAGASVTRSTSTSASESESSSLSRYLNLDFNLSTGYKYKMDASVWFGFGGGTIVENSKELNGELKYTVGVKSDTKINTSVGFGAGQGFETGFTLGDDDDGDQFSVDVLYTGVMDTEAKMSPYFSLVGGRSSCPYEPGTIARDNPTIQLSNELGELLPTAYFDIDPDAVLSIPVTISSGNPFGEQRLVALHTPLASNQHGLGLKIEGTSVNQTKAAVVAIPADTTYQSYLYVSKGNQNWYDFEDIVIQAKPYCSGSSNIWNSGGTVDMEFHYRKPISPLSISSDLGSWFVTDAGNDDSGNEIAEDVTFKLRDYDVEQNLFSLSEVVMEYKRVNDEVWTPMMDATEQAEALSQEALYAYFDRMRNTYPEPTYPFVWELPTGTLDGDYQVRGMVIHENGSIAYSNVLTGTIDRTAPDLVGVANPADGLLNENEQIGFSFTEALDMEAFLNDADHVTVTLLADDLLGTTDAVMSELYYTVTGSGSSISLLINQDTLQKLDGRKMQVSIHGVTDFLGNASALPSYAVDFQVDFFKQSPSPVSLVSTNDWLVNANSEQAVSFTVAGYDVFQTTYSLDNIALQYKRATDTVWTEIESLTAADLVTNYRGVSANVEPVEVITWDVSGMGEGSYDVRAVATGNTGRQSFSGTMSGLIDRIAPALVGTPSPSDSVYHSGDNVSFSFTESLDCDAGFDYSVSVTDYDGTEGTLASVQALCLGSSLKFVFDDNELKDHFGGTVTITVGGYTDVALNAGDTLSYAFRIGNFGRETSPVSLTVANGDWMINEATSTVDLLLTGYDVYELESSLEGIVLQYAAANEADWNAIDTLTQAELAAYYAANSSTNDGNVHYPYTWTPSLVDGSYTVRAVAYGEFGFPEYSGEASGRIDTQSPWIVRITPEDDVIGIGETIKLIFTEAIAAESLTGEAFTLREMVIGTPIGGGANDTTYVKLPGSMYRTEAGGSDITFYFHPDFTMTNEGAKLRLQLAGVTDGVGNVLDTAGTQLFTVVNETMAAQRLSSLALAGEQQQDGSVALHWQQYDLGAAQNYLVERSADGDYFETIGSVQPTEAEALEFLDTETFENRIFYRLRIQRTDGTEVYSRVAVIQDAGIALPLSVEVFPNPIEENILRFSWYSKGSEESVTLEVRDVRGVLVHKEELDLTTRGTQISVQLPEHLDPGMYLLNATQGVQSHSMKFFNP